MQSDSSSLLLGFLTRIHNSLSPFPPGAWKLQQCWEQHGSCHTAAPQHLLCPVLTGVTSQEGHFGPLIKIMAICWRFKCLRVTADLSLSHRALIIHSRAPCWPEARRQSWVSSCLQENRRRTARTHGKLRKCRVCAGGQSIRGAAGPWCCGATLAAEFWLNGCQQGINGDVAEISCTFGS